MCSFQCEATVNEQINHHSRASSPFTSSIARIIRWDRGGQIEQATMSPISRLEAQGLIITIDRLKLTESWVELVGLNAPVFIERPLQASRVAEPLLLSFDNIAQWFLNFWNTIHQFGSNKE
ncbi:hypothetical protein Bca101_042701 [Brassica carinata]